MQTTISLNGSDKQVAWAQIIRANVIAVIDNARHLLPAGAADKLIAAADKQDQAGWWIDHLKNTKPSHDETAGRITGDGWNLHLLMSSSPRNEWPADAVTAYDRISAKDAQQLAHALKAGGIDIKSVIA